ncbi:hypothetical protein I4U23_023599 [Adineta vaga]|nr:hypothetical protein I4U23_023599 [Adineta vaga]
METDSMKDYNEQLLAAALSSILGKEIIPESSVSQQTQQHIAKVSLFDQHLTSFVYGKVGKDNKNIDELFMTLCVTILATKETFPCLIERDASVDKLKQMIYDKSGIKCHKQNLIHCGEEIDEGHLLSEYNIEDASEISVVRLRAMNANDILVMDPNTWDRPYDYDFTNIDDTGKRFTRGSIVYRRPCGWKRFAIKVAGKFENEAWLGSNNSPNEWPVSYHGTRHDAVVSIARTGYDLTKHTRFLFGRGVYSTPDIDVAKAFAKTFILNGEEYYTVIQNRINPRTLIKVNDSDGTAEPYWISPDAADVRPYGFCIKKKY